jgi:hypothetical protein
MNHHAPSLTLYLFLRLPYPLSTQALKTVLGPEAHTGIEDPERLLTREQFVQVMEERINDAAPKFAGAAAAAGAAAK